MLARLGNVDWCDLEKGELPKHLKNADVLWVRLRSKIDASILDAAPKLKIIASPTTGLTHIDTAAAANRNIRIVSLYGEQQFLRSIRATAELTIGLMLSLLRHIPSALEHVRNGSWDRNLFQGTELYSRTVGLVGYGRLGRIVGRYLRAFESNVLATDPCVTPCEAEPEVHIVRMDELLEKSDIVSVHVDLNPGTRGSFGKAQFRRMRRGSYLINTSRGEVLDEHALLDALASGKLAGAALDVVSNEAEYWKSPLIQWASTHSNLIISPHIGGCTSESMARTEVFLAERLCEIASAMGAVN